MGSIKTITTPDFGGATDVTVIEVLIKPGDSINVDTPLVTLESDKATMELPSTEAGIVKEIKVKVGDKVTTGSAILTLESGKADSEPTQKTQAKTAKSGAKSASSTQKTSEETASLTEKEIPEKEKTQASEPESPAAKPPEKETTEEDKRVLTGTLESNGDIHAGPGVRRLARELGVNLAAITGTGPKQRILKEDLQMHVKQQLTQIRNGGLTPVNASLPAIDFAQFGPTEVQALSRIKKISGKNLQRNWMLIPHVTQFGEADITSLEDFRQAQKQTLDKKNVRLTPLVFIMKAVVVALKAFPLFNASLDANGENLILKRYFNLGVAVDTPDGLVVPVIRDVDKKGLIDLAAELAEISDKARKKQLMPAHMQGGCFSISSLGGIGGTAFTPIINYPEVAILGVSRSSYKPVFKDNAFVPRLMLPLSLSYDHRVIDGAEGARFMVHMTELLSDIRHLLL